MCLASIGVYLFSNGEAIRNSILNMNDIICLLAGHMEGANVTSHLLTILHLPSIFVFDNNLILYYLPSFYPVKAMYSCVHISKYNVLIRNN